MEKNSRVRSPQSLSMFFGSTQNNVIDRSKLNNFLSLHFFLDEQKNPQWESLAWLLPNPFNLLTLLVFFSMFVNGHSWPNSEIVIRVWSLQTFSHWVRMIQHSGLFAENVNNPKENLPSSLQVLFGVYLCIYVYMYICIYIYIYLLYLYFIMFILHPISIKKRTALFLSWGHASNRNRHVRSMELCPSASCLHRDLTHRGIEDGSVWRVVECGVEGDTHKCI